ncbi:MAG: transposase, partial [bacterium]|nr:transposase [bacterium]
MDATDITTPTPPDDYDSPWKEVSGRFFPQLVEFFAPDLYAIIDWSAGYEFLEQELREMLRDAETGPRRVDKVVKVRTLSGKPLYLVLHVEIQVSRESGFPRRMFVYFYRLYDLYPEQVVSLAILADEEPDWEPKSYEYALHGTELEFGYRTVKIWEYNGRWAELEKDPNPFALVVMAHLKTKATRGKARERLAWKVNLVRQLYERGYERKDVLELFRFIDWLLVLPEEMTKSFRQRIEEIEQESKMKYVTSIERLGRREGRQEGLRDVVLALFEEKFGPPDAPI